MLDQEEVIGEKPIDFPAGEYQIHNSIDYGINVALVSIGWLLAATFFISLDMIIIAGLFNIVLGSYQLISALAGAFRKNTKKRNYFLGAVAYLLFLVLFSSVANRLFNSALEDIYWTSTLLVLPLIGASYYTHLCYNAKYEIS